MSFIDYDIRPRIPHKRHNGKPWPAHESLQEYAERRRLPIDKAYKTWHERSYEAADIVHGNPERPGGIEAMRLRAHGPGLGLTAQDVRSLEIARLVDGTQNGGAK